MACLCLCVSTAKIHRYNRKRAPSAFSKRKKSVHALVIHILYLFCCSLFSTKTVDESELPGIKAAAAQKGNKAQIDLDQNGVKTSYSVTPDQINSTVKDEANKQQAKATHPSQL